MVKKDLSYISNLELWRPIPGLPEIYWASSHGRVKSIRQLKGGRLETILNGYIMNIGYRRLDFKIKGKKAWAMVHDLIARTFLGPRPLKAVINHIDHDKLNNHISNLEYVTQKRNCEEAAKLGKLGKWTRTPEHRQKISLMRSGVPCPTRPLTKEQADEIRRLRSSMTLVDLARQFGISKKAVLNIIKGRTYKS